MNHSIYKTFNIPAGAVANGAKVIYISQSLFDCDSTNVEFLSATHKNIFASTRSVTVYRENGDTVFTKFNANLRTHDNRYYELPAIYKTPLGTKMILESYHPNHQPADSLQIYGLCGNLPTNLLPNTLMDQGLFSSLFPNPSDRLVTIEYQIPDGELATLQLISQNGQLLKSYRIDSNFNQLTLDLEEEGISPGIYYYSITTDRGKRESRKLIKIE